jgi:hypothetical protein
MRARTVFTASLLACLALLLAGAGACGSSPGTTESRANGQSCGSTGNSSCASDHCDNGFCCAAGNCCGVAGDCPASYRSPAACDDTGPTTTCQGKRRDATCAEGTCATATVDDDSACAGAVRDCTPFRPITCTSAASQPVATCLTACTGNADCAAGYACAGGQCLVKVGMGAACSGAGQGTCNDGLKCENAICCDAAAGTCCTASAQCAGGLACDTATTHACFTTCADNDSSRCASAGSYCQSNACVAKLAQGAACTAGGQCPAGFCAQGVCCDSACAGTCQSCNDPANPGGRGTCGQASAGTSCSDGNACSSGDACDGAGHCAGTPFSCVGGLCKTSTCNGTGCTVVNLTGPACLHCGTCENGVCVGAVPVGLQCP